jgi:cytochrome c
MTMVKSKWTAPLLLATILCSACDSGSEAGKDVAIPGTAGYDPEKIELAKKSNCFSCHAMEKKMIGPSFKDMAARYRGDPGAEERLVTKVAKGSSGAWGSIPMPANSPPVTEADIRAMVKFILSL